MNHLWKLFRTKETSSSLPCSDPSLNIICSEFEVNNWLISEFLVKELVPIVGVHPFPLNELFLMVAAVCRLKPTHIFEWGTHIGKSARAFYEISKYFKLGIEIHSTDLPDEVNHQEHPGHSRGGLVKGLERVTLHQGDGLTKSLEILKRVHAERSVFFIDGDHDYASVKRELHGIIQNVPHANLLLHDTFYQSPESAYNIGPYKAITETLSYIPNKFRVISTNTGSPGMTLLYQL